METAANAGLIVALVGLAVAGCETPPGGSTQSDPAAASASSEQSALPIPVVRARQFVAAILPLGTVPYDGFALPIVRPDGRAVATQTGYGPSWPTVLAEPDAVVPRGSAISVYDLSWADGEASHRFTVNEPAILGRSCDQRGFLIESPRSDGSRWIGYVAWETGAIQWLVADKHVNAFASLGREGQLAWSRRAQDAAHFDLVIRTAENEWTIAAEGDDWLMPTFSGVGRGLFIMRLNRGELAATFMSAADPESSRRSLGHLTLMTSATRRDAYQSLASHAGILGSASHRTNHLVFFHPSSLRMAIWQPTTTRAGASILLAEHSTAGMITSDGLALITDAHSLIVQSVVDLSDRRRIVPGVQIPHPIASKRWPIVLAGPAGGLVDLTALRLLSADQLDDR